MRSDVLATLIRVNGETVALPMPRKGQVIVMHIDDFLNVRPLHTRRGPLPDLQLSPGLVKRVRAPLMQWIDGNYRQGLYGSETSRDFYGRVLFTTAQDATAALNAEGPPTPLSTHIVGKVMLGLGFKVKRVRGVAGGRVQRYFTPAYLLPATPTL